MNKAKYKYFIQHNKTVSYIWKSRVAKFGYDECSGFKVTLRGENRQEEARKMCALLNESE